MCMYSVAQQEENDKIVYGYKIFFRDSLETGMSGPYKRKVWYESSPQEESSTVGSWYTTGFHAFLNKKDAKMFRGGNQRVFKVKLRGIMYKGLHTVDASKFGNAVVAKEMMILEEV